MPWNYNFIDHTADIAYDVSGDTIEELFIAAAMGFKETMVENAEVVSKEEKKINLNEDSLEELLVYFIDELNFYIQAKKWIFSEMKNISINKNKGEFILNAVVLGEPLKPDKHDLKTEIKAVTFHQMKIERTNGKFSTRIVFDI